MSDLFPPWPLFGAFLLASFLLAVTPGPGVLYIVSRSATQGRLSGLASVAGVACGNLGNALGASLGLAVLFTISHIAFFVVKYAGAIYLLYLGVKTLSTSSVKLSTGTFPQKTFLHRIFVDGFVVALLNPKTAMFFVAFLPQFISAPKVAFGQTLALSVIFVFIAATTDTLYALAAGTTRPWLAKKTSIGAIGKYLAGGTFIGLGLLAAFSPASIHKK